MKLSLLFILKAVTTIIMLQSLFFKFSGSSESVDLFSKIIGNHEAILRIGTGVLELLASILIFMPKKTWLGATLTIILMLGAIIGHLTKIGIEHNNDGGLLFLLAVLALSGGIALFSLHQKDAPWINFTKQ